MVWGEVFASSNWFPATKFGGSHRGGSATGETNKTGCKTGYDSDSFFSSFLFSQIAKYTNSSKFKKNKKLRPG